MNSDDQNHDPDEDEYVTIDAYLEMTARMLGRIHALEAALVAVLSRRPDLSEIERHADAIIINDEASRIDTFRTDDETMRTHEWARQSALALFGNAMLARSIK